MEDSRTTLSRTSRQASMGTGRATVREFDDDHLMQQVKSADVTHSETPTDFERFQMVGLTSVPLKQSEDENKKSDQKKTESNEQGDWNHDQPKGKAAEALMIYVGGSRSHPVGLVDDRRVRPYGMKPGESALYAASGTGQMLLHNDDGSMMVTTNNPSEEKDAKEKERYVSMRHVDKKKQKRELKKDEKIDKPNHEGETVNMEIRTTKSRIEFRAGDTVVGFYDKSAKRWCFIGEIKLGSEDADHPVYGKNQGVGKTAKPSGEGAVLIKAPKPGPPASEDSQP